MALLTCHCFSDVLGLNVALNVILPQPTGEKQIGVGSAPSESMPNDSAFPGWPTLYLLHGLSDDHTIWCRRTSIERYVAEMNLAVVMPAAGRSFYTDMAHGGRYFTFIAEELPALVRQFFRLSDRREDNFVAGLSMGGYGAYKVALRYPERFSFAASLSGALHMARHVHADHPPERQAEWRDIFGDLDRLPGSDNDLFHLAETLKPRCDQLGLTPPTLYQCCGDADFLIEPNHRFAAHAKALGLNHQYDVDPGDGHHWAYWDRRIQTVLDRLPIKC